MYAVLTIAGKTYAVRGDTLAEMAEQSAAGGGLPKSAVELRSGQTGRSKVLELSGITAEQLKAILER